MSRNNSVGIATGYGLNSPGSISDRRKIVFHYQSVQTSSGTHPASYPMGNGDEFPEAKRQGREADHSPPSSVEVKDGGGVPPLPPYVSMAQCLIN
jgi:hypothetical protein